jgi:hypothetical protein
MAGPDDFEDPGPDEPLRPHRGRWLLQVVIVVVLVISMVFLAFVSGRGVVTVRPVTVPDPTAPVVPTGGSATRTAAPPTGPGTLTAVGPDLRLGRWT